MIDSMTEPREARTPMALLPYQQRWCADRAQVLFGAQAHLAQPGGALRADVAEFDGSRHA